MSTIHVLVPTMVCNTCVRNLTNAIQAQFPAAIINADLDTKQLHIEVAATPEQVRALIVDAGHEVAI